MSRTIKGLLAIALVMGLAAPAAAITQLIGDVDGFGISPLGLYAANGGPADTDADGIIEGGEYLPDWNRDGAVAINRGDAFDFRSPAELAASNGAELTDYAIIGSGAAHGATFTFTFPVPTLGDIDYGVDHYINFVFGDYDVVPATISVDGTVVSLTTQGAGNDGLVQTAFASVPWADLTDGTVIIQVNAPNEPYLAFDFALLDTDQIADRDGDGVPDNVDNCPDTPNTDQEDFDGDGIGDACDPCTDGDGDGICEGEDNCPEDANPDQLDTDGDGEGDACDACPYDGDNDADGDGACGDNDNCPYDFNPDQLDSDADGAGDVCDICPFDPDDDADGDGFCADADNCPNDPNPDQADGDGDGKGDVCDDCPFDPDNDADDDGVCGDEDLCPDTTIPETAVPAIRLGTNRFALTDGDGVFDTTDPKGRGPGRYYTIEDTGGCSCEQILAELDLGMGHYKFGCSISAMDDWTALLPD